jgi:hypothetical protein
MLLRIDARGGVHCLYTEALPLAALGSLSIRRASHVEPEGDGWYADLSPVHGPKLGPFATRAQALRAEEAWIDASGLAAPDAGA